MATTDRERNIVAEEESAAEAERALGRALAIGVPAVTIAATVAVGVVSSAGPALLVLGAGAILGTITLLWASLRTLGGDAPLPADLEAVAARTHEASAAEAKKRSLLRQLKDLENERAIGKIDDDDYVALSNEYRAQAKETLRELDDQIAPKREKAEELAAKYLAKKGLAETGDAPKDEAKPGCAKCGTLNDADAAFCKKCGNALQTTTDETATS